MRAFRCCASCAEDRASSAEVVGKCVQSCMRPVVEADQLAQQEVQMLQVSNYSRWKHWLVNWRWHSNGIDDIMFRIDWVGVLNSVRTSHVTSSQLLELQLLIRRVKQRSHWKSVWSNAVTHMYILFQNLSLNLGHPRVNVEFHKHFDGVTRQ